MGYLLLFALHFVVEVAPRFLFAFQAENRISLSFDASAPQHAHTTNGD